jgi:hypothetical protein
MEEGSNRLKERQIGNAGSGSLEIGPDADFKKTDRAFTGPGNEQTQPSSVIAEVQPR